MCFFRFFFRQFSVPSELRRPLSDKLENENISVITLSLNAHKVLDAYLL